MTEKSADTYILSEETYQNEIETIIERDFFPDLPDVRCQLREQPRNVSSSRRSPRRKKKAIQTLPTTTSKLSLNAFLDKFTSDDNFKMAAKLKQDTEAQHKAKFKWLHEKKSLTDHLFSPQLNSLMFHPPTLKPGKSNKLGICHRNTRTIRLRQTEKIATATRGAAASISLVATPIPSPGMGQTPLVTWGDIKTPVLLSPLDALPPRRTPNRSPSTS